MEILPQVECYPGIERHHGSIECISQAEEESEFMVSIALHQE
jgi:hypothetical protein